MLKNWRDKVIFILALVAIILALLQMKAYNDLKRSEEQIQINGRNTVAIDGKLKPGKNKDGDSTYTQNAVEGKLDDIINSPDFKRLTEKQKEFYLKDIKKLKGLLAASEYTIDIQNKTILELTNKPKIKESDSTVTFLKKDSLIFEDSTDNSSMRAVIKMSSFKKMDYKSREYIDILSSYQRIKDTVKVSYVIKNKNPKINIQIKDGQALLIPFAAQETKWQKFVKTATKTGIIILPPAAFITGIYLGLRIR